MIIGETYNQMGERAIDNPAVCELYCRLGEKKASDIDKKVRFVAKRVVGEGGVLSLRTECDPRRLSHTNSVRLFVHHIGVYRV